MKSLMAIPLLMWAVSAAAESTLIEVFADGPADIPRVPNATVIAYDVDIDARAERIRPRFDASSVEEAQAMAYAWRNSQAFNEYAEQMLDLYAPLERLTQLQLTRVPAVVFNESFVVYGTTDVGRAIDDYLNFTKQEQP